MANGKFTAAEFRGFVKAKLEGIGDDMAEMKIDIKQLKENQVALKIKQAVMGAGGGAGIVAIIEIIRGILR